LDQIEAGKREATGNSNVTAALTILFEDPELETFNI
jgi:hypothetical protein